MQAASDGQVNFAVAPDVGHCDTFKVKVDNGEVYLAV
jgi:hypothetical protein